MTQEEKKTILREARIDEILLTSRVRELSHLIILFGDNLNPDYNKQIQREMRELQKRMQKIHNAINQLKNEEQLVLRLRYIDGLQWDEIVGIMKCCRSKTFILHDKALKNLVIN